jgi:hypothetical protein
MNSSVWRYTAFIRYTLQVKEIQFRLLSTTFFFFLRPSRKVLIVSVIRGNDQCDPTPAINQYQFLLNPLIHTKHNHSLISVSTT